MTIDTAPAASFTFNDFAVADTIFVADGPFESGFQTTQLTYANGISTYIFANKTAVTIDGQNQGDSVVLDNTDPAFGMQSLTVQNLGTGGTIKGGNPNAGGADIAVAILSLQAFGGIGTAARPLRTQVGTLNAVASTGGIFITNGVNAPV